MTDPAPGEPGFHAPGQHEAVGVAEDTSTPAAPGRHEAGAVPAAAGAQERGHGTHKYVVLVIVLAAVFMQLLDVSIVNVAIPNIQDTLHASYSNVQLVLVGYQLGFACTLVTASRLGDIWGRRKMFLIGMVAFTSASALCGAAVNPEMLIASRVFQGLASGLMFPQVLSVIQVVFPPMERAKAFGIYGATIGLGTILGPTLGGLLIQAALVADPWRAIFYVNLPIGIAAFVLGIKYLPESRAPKASKLDLPGALLITIGLALLVYPLSVGREKHWPLWIIVMALACIPFLAGFAFYSKKKSAADASPLLDTALFKDKAFRVGIVLSLVFFAGVPPFFFVTSLYLQIGNSFTALHAGLTTLAFAVGSAFASARSDKLAQKIGQRILPLGCGLLAIGHVGTIAAVHFQTGTATSYWFIPSLLVTGLGLGCFIAPVTRIVLAGVQPRLVGNASGVLSTMQQIGGVLGVAIVGVIFFGLLTSHAPTSADTQVTALRTQLLATGQQAPQVDAEVAQFRTCFKDRSSETDPNVTPASCMAPAGTDPNSPQAKTLAAAFASTAQRANVDNFRAVESETLIYEVVVALIALGLCFALPKVPVGGPPGGPGAGGPGKPGAGGPSDDHALAGAGAH